MQTTNKTGTCKRLLAVVLTICMVLSMFPAVVFAAEEETAMQVVNLLADGDFENGKGEWVRGTADADPADAENGVLRATWIASKNLNLVSGNYYQLTFKYKADAEVGRQANVRVVDYDKDGNVLSVPYSLNDRLYTNANGDGWFELAKMPTTWKSYDFYFKANISGSADYAYSVLEFRGRNSNYFYLDDVVLNNCGTTNDLAKNLGFETIEIEDDPVANHVAAAQKEVLEAAGITTSDRFNMWNFNGGSQADTGYVGNYSVKYVVPTGYSANNAPFSTLKTAVEAGKTYVISFWLNAEVQATNKNGARAHFYLDTYNGDEKVAENVISLTNCHAGNPTVQGWFDGATSWQRYQVEYTVPAEGVDNIKYKVNFGSADSATSTGLKNPVWLDQLSIVEKLAPVAEAHVHTWADADCDTPKTCSVCGATEGEALGHDWADADCDTPKTCSVCGATEGEALGHSWENGVCSVCGADDPNAPDDSEDTEMQVVNLLADGDFEDGVGSWTKGAAAADPDDAENGVLKNNLMASKQLKLKSGEYYSLSFSYKNAEAPYSNVRVVDYDANGNVLDVPYSLNARLYDNNGSGGWTTQNVKPATWTDFEFYFKANLGGSADYAYSVMEIRGAQTNNAYLDNVELYYCGAGTELATNGGFESGVTVDADFSEGVPTQMNEALTALGITTWDSFDFWGFMGASKKADGYVGANSVKYQAPTTVSLASANYKSVPVEAGKTYVISFWLNGVAQSTSNCSSRASFYADTYNGTELVATNAISETNLHGGHPTWATNMGAETSWQRYEVQYTVPEGVDSIQYKLHLSAEANGSTGLNYPIWLDEVSVVEKLAPVAEAHVHTWTDADCDTPKTCSVCGATEGEALGHDWADADCDTPKTCSVCGATEGEALGHSMSNATCTAPATCSVCGATEGTTLDHSWVDAGDGENETCSVCGATQPKEPVTPEEPEDTANLLPDGDFEDGVGSWTKGAAAADPDDAENGVLKNNLMASKKLELKSGEYYSLSFSYKNAEAPYSNVRIVDYGKDGKVLSVPYSLNARLYDNNGTGGWTAQNVKPATWTDYEFYFKANLGGSADYAYSVMEIRGAQTNNAYLDNVELYYCGTTTELATNGGFETGVTEDADFSEGVPTQMANALTALGITTHDTFNFWGFNGASTKDTGYVGSNSVKYASASGVSLASLNYKAIPVEAGKTYVISFWLNGVAQSSSNTSSRANFFADTYNGTEKVATEAIREINLHGGHPTWATNMGAVTSWQRYEIRYTAPQGVDSFQYRIQLAAEDTGSGLQYATWLDEVSVVELVAPHFHDYVKTVVPPTCTDKGYDLYKCECGDSYTENETNTVPHTEAEAVKENEVAADCDTAGSYDEVVYCSVCGEELSRTTTTVDALGHTQGEPVKENIQAGDCETPNSYDLVVRCTVCNEVLSSTPGRDSAPGHSPATAVKENEVAADCDTAGSYDEVVYCSVCGEEVSRTTITVDALGHTEAEPVKENEVAADCDTAGSYDEVVYCSVCGEEVSRTTTTVDALGHTEAEAVKENEVAADCENEGSYDEVVYCSVCGEELDRETTTVDALGHTEGEAVRENEVAPGYGKEGSYDEVVYCSVCDEELSRETKTIPALQHDPGEVVIENVVDATCTEDGSYDEVVYCKECGEELSRNTVTVPALGESAHDWDAEVVNPTLFEDGYTIYTCSICGDSYIGDYTDALLPDIGNTGDLLRPGLVIIGGAASDKEMSYGGLVLDTEEPFVLYGYGNGETGENDLLTRAQMATLLYRSLSTDNGYFYNPIYFNDVPAGAWFKTPVDILSSAGVMIGYDGCFNPNDNLTWAQIITIMARFVDYEPADMPWGFAYNNHWAIEAMETAYALGWIEDPMTLKPDQAITRGEVVEFVNHVFDVFNG